MDGMGSARAEAGTRVGVGDNIRTVRRQYGKDWIGWDGMGDGDGLV